MPAPGDTHATRWHGGPPWWAGEAPPDWRAPRWATLWIPVIVSFLIQVPAAIAIARFTGQSPRETAIAVGIALVGPLALIAARRFPGPVVAITAVASSLDLFVNERGGPPYVALAFAIVSAIVRDARIWAWVSIGVCWIASITMAAVLGREEWTPFRIAGTTLGILIVFGIGEGMRTRRERAAEFRRRADERRQGLVQAERVRIARELHDVLAHSLSQINVQAGVGLHLMDKQPDKARDALASIKDTSKTALDEVRSVLGTLRSEGADAPLVPEPDLDRLPQLVAGVSGLRVELDDRLAHAAVPAPVQLALYRIVQESLTNIARHADGATTARVLLHR
ncbi:MAG: histidine kinase, partial [Schumannella sp.]